MSFQRASGLDGHNFSILLAWMFLIRHNEFTDSIGPLRRQPNSHSSCIYVINHFYHEIHFHCLARRSTNKYSTTHITTLRFSTATPFFTTSEWPQGHFENESIFSKINLDLNFVQFSSEIRIIIKKFPSSERSLDPEKNDYHKAKYPGRFFFK